MNICSVTAIGELLSRQEHGQLGADPYSHFDSMLGIVLKITGEYIGISYLMLERWGVPL